MRSELSKIKRKHDIIISSQLLWKILEKSPNDIDNCNKMVEVILV